MPPGPDNEQPCLLHEHGQQDLNPTVLPDNEVVAAAESAMPLNLRKHPGDLHLEGTAKRTKLSSDNETLTGKSAILSMTYFK